MKRVGLLLFGLVALVGCRTAHDVAVSSFRVLDAPANYVRKHIDGSTETTTTTTTTASSDTVTNPGRTVTPTTNPQTGPRPKPTASPATVTEKSKPSSSPSRTTSTQIPTAKPVPGKPGYVFSPFDPGGGYVDVTGYSSGQKVKDPYSGKIFLVP